MYTCQISKSIFLPLLRLVCLFSILFQAYRTNSIKLYMSIITLCRHQVRPPQIDKMVHRFFPEKIGVSEQNKYILFKYIYLLIVCTPEKNIYLHLFLFLDHLINFWWPNKSNFGVNAISHLQKHV